MQPPTPSRRKPTKNPPQTRREFLAKAALLTGGILTFGLPLPFRQSRSALAAARPQAAGIRYILELGGQIAGPISSLDSGFISGQVIEHPSTQSSYPQKQLAGILYEDIAMKCGQTMSPALYQWIQQTLAGPPSQRSGAILTTNLNNQITDRKQFEDALLTEVTFPALNALAATTPVALGLTIKSSQLTYQGGSGSQIGVPLAPKVSPWLASNFRLMIDGLEQACNFVTQVEPILWKRAVTQSPVGARHAPVVTSGQIQTSPLVITLPQSQAAQFTQWFYQFVVQGQASDADERSGTLEYLTSDRQARLFTLRFEHLGILRMSPVPQSEASGNPLVKVEMYFESLQLTEYPGGGSPNR
ncbi:MAG: hypothetical protein AB7P17_11560 [Nitrospirales bacterium]|nr:phage tail protein [Nitrospirales bacterium]